MTNYDPVSPAHERPASLSRVCVKAALLVLVLTQGARAQTATSVTDGSTPSALAPGAPAGTYTLSGFDSVNLYNGNLNFALPLLQNVGRGAAGAAVTLKVEQHWRVKRLKPLPNCELTGTCDPTLVPDSNAWLGGAQDYGPGVLRGRSGGVTCGDLALTRLTFTASDGTEFELRDQLRGGQPLNFSCNPSQGALRGTVFVTADGTAATFISDAPIYDWTGMAPTTISPSGVLKLKDGMVYRIDAGMVSWTRDRNGNRVSYTYEGTRVKTITDSLGRVVTINYGVQDDEPYGLCDQFIYNGFGGGQRVVRVSYARLNSVLRTNRPGDAPSPRTVAQLFPDFQGSSTTLYNPVRKSAVWLPDDGVVRRAYKLSYNAYGELARVELPTGGAIEYDFGDYIPHFQDEIFRGIAERRVYPDGTSLGARTTYTGTGAGATVDTYDAWGVLLTRSKHYFHGFLQSSLAQKPTDYAGWQEGREYKTELFDVAGGVASAVPSRRVEQDWKQRAPVSWWSGSPDVAPPNDPRVVETVTTLEPGGANLVSKQSALDPRTGAVGFDQFNNQTDAWAYDFGAGAPPRYPVSHSRIDYLSEANGVDYTSAGGVHIRGLVSARRVYAVNPADGTETPAAQSETRFDEPSYSLLACDPELSVPCSAVPQWADPGTNARGNPTTTRRWLDTANAWVETHTQYDQLGNARKSWDARGSLSEVTYKDSFVSTNPGASVANTFAFPTRAASSAAQSDDSSPFGAHQPLVVTTVYDYSTGLPSSTTDPNNRTTVFLYAGAGGVPDPLDRLKAVVRPDGGRTVYEYGDVVGDLYVRALTDLDGTRRVESKQYFDGLGRPYRRATYENYVSSASWINVDTEYDALGRVVRSSMPYRAAEGAAPFSTDKWAETTYDALGRVRKVTTRPDGAAVTTDYSGDRVLVKDQAGKERVSRADALGRLTDVWEVTAAEVGAEASTVPVAAFPGHAEAAYGYLTSYRYDALGRLRMVEQAGQHAGQPVTQRRFFAYDSLGRLVRARYPEQGLINNPSNDPDFPAFTDPVTQNSQWSLAFRYDENGNLLARVDARLVGQPGAQSNLKVRYAYDALNRNTAVDYSDTPTLDPDVMRYYDGAAGGLGLPWKSEAARTALTTVEQYDAAGRPVQRKQQFWVAGQWGQAYTTLFDYDLAGDLKTLVYPSGHKVEYQYDAAGRLGDNGALPAFKGTLGDGVERAYASQVVYDELGGMNQERFGTAQPVYNKQFYNSRGQLSQIRVSTYAYTDLPNRENWNRGALINHFSEQSWAGSGTDNNGNLAKQDVYIPDNDQVSGYSLSTFFYEYDALNRLRKAKEGQDGSDKWVQSYDYDRWGNRTVNAAGTRGVGAPQFSVDAYTNRLGVPAGQTGQIAYDAAGNQTLDTYQGGRGGGGTRTYDAEGRLTSAQFFSGQTQTAVYVYDADGQRVKRAVGTGEEAWQVYGAGGELLAEYAPNAAPAQPRKEYGYRGGELLITAAAGAPQQGDGGGTDAAAFVSQTVPAAMTAGRTYQVFVTMRNTGTSTWTSGESYNLGTQNPQDNSTWGLARVALPFAVAPGAEVTFGFNVNAPATPGTYNFQWRMVRDGVAWFGADSTNVAVPVAAQAGDAAEFVRQSLPSVMQAGRQYAVSVVMKNTGTSSWTTANYYSLGSQNPQDNYTWGTPRVALPGPVAPNGEVTFNFTVTAPTTPGAYNFRWRMVHDTVAWFGAYTPNVSVNVTAAAPADGATFVAQTVPAAMTAGGRYEVTLTMRNSGTSSWATSSYYSLGSQNPQDNFTWGMARAALPGSVAPGSDVTFRFVVTAPATPGTYNFRWRMVHDTVAWFGADSTNVSVQVVSAGGGSGADIRWLVTDQLGTPRMLLDKTGSLANVSRHDYLPFGEEIRGETAWRTPERGYRGDPARQQFTGYEHDAEINLDYAQARYYSGQAGRFTSPDPLLASGRAARPQSWNRYSYALNNPLRFTDPSGLAESQATCKQEPDGQQKQVTVPKDVESGAAKNWLIDEDQNGEFDGEVEFQPSEAGVLAGVATAQYQAQFIKTTDELNADAHGGVSQTTVQQDTSSANSSGTSSQQSASVTGEVSGQPKLTGTLGMTDGRTTGATNTGGTSISQTLDPVARCNAMALDKDATIKTNNAINALEGKTVTVYRGETATPLKLTRPMAATVVRGVSIFARSRARTDAIVSYPAPLKK